MREIDAYQLLKDNDPNDLTDQVLQMMNNDWQPWGAPTVANTTNGAVYIQAVVLYRKAQP